MIKIYTIIFFSCFLFVNSFAQSQLSSDKLVSKYFYKDQISDLEGMIHFFEYSYCQWNSEKCWPELLNNMKVFADSSGIDIRISIDQIDSMYLSLHSSTFDEIWTFDGCFTRTKTDTFPCISYKRDGAFIRLITELAESNKVIKDYLSSYYSSLDINPGMVGSIIYHYGQLNLNDPNIILFLTIHYITFFDQSIRKAKSKKLE